MALGMAVDLHAHLMSKDALREMRAAHPDHAPELADDGDHYSLHYPGRAPLGPIPPSMFDVQRRLEDMSAVGVHRQILAVPPPQFYYQVPASVGADFARIQNDAMVAVSDLYPDRLHLFGTLPLQDPQASAREVARLAANPRVRGVEIGTNINGMDLDNPELGPVWNALQEAELPVWVHPDQRSVAGADRLGPYYLLNLIGNPLETTIAIARLMFGGVLQSHLDLRFGFVHGGGLAPYQLGRWEHGWACRAEPKKIVPDRSPKDQFSGLFFDSLTHDRDALELLGKRVGWDHVVLGSDYPFDMASSDPVGAVRELGLIDSEQQAVLSSTADRFLRPCP